MENVQVEVSGIADENDQNLSVHLWSADPENPYTSSSQKIVKKNENTLKD